MTLCHVRSASPHHWSHRHVYIMHLAALEPGSPRSPAVTFDQASDERSIARGEPRASRRSFFVGVPAPGAACARAHARGGGEQLKSDSERRARRSTGARERCEEGGGESSTNSASLSTTTDDARARRVSTHQVTAPPPSGLRYNPRSHAFVDMRSATASPFPLGEIVQVCVSRSRDDDSVCHITSPAPSPPEQPRCTPFPP